MAKPVVDVRTSLSAQGAVRICVDDAGKGIAPAMLDRIFAPFETTKTQGMGLGLTVSRTIVSSHGGMIWAENLAPGARLCLEFGQAGDPA
jgi:two-component system, LuxR family, sensor kinase FixL